MLLHGIRLFRGFSYQQVHGTLENLCRYQALLKLFILIGFIVVLNIIVLDLQPYHPICCILLIRQDLTFFNPTKRKFRLQTQKEKKLIYRIHKVSEERLN
jgi:hypothetical protein